MFSSSVLKLEKNILHKLVLEVITVSVIAAHTVSSNPVSCDLLLNMLDLLRVAVI